MLSTAMVCDCACIESRVVVRRIVSVYLQSLFLFSFCGMRGEREMVEE